MLQVHRTATEGRWSASHERF